MIMSLFVIIFLVVLLLFLLQFSFSSEFLVSDPQLSSLESGFESIKTSLSMSSSYFLLAALFVLFDLELIIIMPLIQMWSKIILSSFLTMIFLFIFIFVSLALEWWLSALKWQS